MPKTFQLTSYAAPFNDGGIGSAVTSFSPGVYVLGSPHPSGGVTVGYVGRADTDLANRLKNHELRGRYSHFVFAYAVSADDAYKKECEMYHEWIGHLGGQIHPAKPERSSIRCPECGS